MKRFPRGMTLLEMLVVLVLSTLLATLVVQGLGFFLGKYDAVRRFQAESLQASLQRQWFVTTVQGLVPIPDGERAFRGARDGFQGLTLAPLAGEAGRPQIVRWQLEAPEEGPMELVYSEETQLSWSVFRSDRGALTLEYADGAGTWHPRWPPDRTMPRLPALIRLAGPDGETVWLARPELYPEPLTHFLEDA